MKIFPLLSEEGSGSSIDGPGGGLWHKRIGIFFISLQQNKDS